MTRRLVYLVQRVSLEERNAWIDREGWGLCPEPNRACGPSRVPLCLFSERSQADAWRAKLECAARINLCPFTLSPDLQELTSLSEEQLQDRILDLGLMPAVEWVEVGWLDWVRWWEETVPSMTAAQVDAIWDLLDRLHLYQVVALELDAPTR